MSGRLICVGVGMTLGAHLCPISRSHIEIADVVFSAVSDGFVELWLNELHHDVRSLQDYYAADKSRHITYQEMVDVMLAEVRLGKKVVGAFYGHPGVFAKSPHEAIAQAKREGFTAQMIPGISAEDCLYADLGIDPGKFGCQHFETTQFMLYQRRVDPSAYLVLWQIGLAGDLSMGIAVTGREERQLLLELLSKDYPLTHECYLYEAPTMPLQTPRIDKLELQALLDAPIHLHTTLVIPPALALQDNHDMRRRLKQLAANKASIAAETNCESNRERTLYAKPSATMSAAASNIGATATDLPPQRNTDNVLPFIKTKRKL